MLVGSGDEHEGFVYSITPFSFGTFSFASGYAFAGDGLEQCIWVRCNGDESVTVCVVNVCGAGDGDVVMASSMFLTLEGFSSLLL